MCIKNIMQRDSSLCCFKIGNLCRVETPAAHDAIVSLATHNGIGKHGVRHALRHMNYGGFLRSQKMD